MKISVALIHTESRVNVIKNAMLMHVGGHC